MYLKRINERNDKWRKFGGVCQQRSKNRRDIISYRVMNHISIVYTVWAISAVFSQNAIWNSVGNMNVVWYSVNCKMRFEKMQYEFLPVEKKQHKQTGRFSSYLMTNVLEINSLESKIINSLLNTKNCYCFDVQTIQWEKLHIGQENERWKENDQ